MSQLRICDVDATPINAQTDEYFTVTAGRDGRTKDVCVRCAHSLAGVLEWSPETDYEVGDRVTPTVGGGVFVVSVAGASGTDEPTWPEANLPGVVADGSVTYVSVQVPNGNIAIHKSMPGQSVAWLSLWGWLTDSGEANDVTV